MVWSHWSMNFESGRSSLGPICTLAPCNLGFAGDPLRACAFISDVRFLRYCFPGDISACERFYFSFWLGPLRLFRPRERAQWTTPDI